MGSLFWRLFFSFWLVISTLLLAHWGTTWLVTQQFESSERLGRLLDRYADQAIQAWQQGGEPALRAWQAQLHRQDGLRAALLDANGLPLSRPGHLRGMLPMHEPGMRHHGGRRPLLWSVSREDQDFTLIVFNPRQLRDPLFAGFTLLWRVVLTVGVVALLAALMARYLTRPIRQLQQASRGLAEGALDTRVDGQLAQRRDELGDLGRDFDRMALRLQQLVEGQQQLLRDVSHELRTPLARQRIALELARRKPDPGAELDRIEREAEQLDQLIEEILHWVRLSSPADRQALEQADLAALVTQLVDNANFEQPRVSYQGPAQCELAIEPRQIGRALENVIRNALKYSQQAVIVTLNCQPERIEIRVQDSGPGIAPDLLDSIFEPFVRTDSARSRDAGGWGLGLAIAARAVRRHHGEISAHNRDGGGLDVVMTLPRSPLG